MKQKQRGRWLAPLGAMLVLCVAFHWAASPSHGLQQQQQQHQQVAGNVEHQAEAAAAAAMMSPMEASSALESSSSLGAGSLVAEDLIAAESSQSPDAPAEHKAFTVGAQMMRQESQQQMAASVAPPVFAGPQQQQQQQQQQGQQMYPPPQLAARLQPPHKANFNPFMAAALAGNYGPAQQQIAAAAAASLHAHGQVPHAPVHHHQGAHHPALPGPPQQHHPQQHHPQQQHLHQQQQPQQHQHQHHQHHQQQMSHQQQMGPMHQQQQLAGPPQAQGQPMAVQESAVRHNIVPAPHHHFAQQQAAQSQAQGQPQPQPQPAASIELSNSIEPNELSSGQSLAVASSAQHPVIATATSLAPQASSTVISSASGAAVAQQDAWPLQAPDIPKIVNLEVKCEKNLMKVSIEFDKLFNGVIFSKGHFNQGQCVHVSQNSGKQQAYFDISINSCGTQGNTQNGLYGMGGNTGSGTYFENTIVIQYDPNVQEVYDHARKLRCTWHDQYEKAVTFRPFPVDMLDIVRADFAGDNVGCWMQIQVGKGPWASEVAGIVKIGQTMTMVLAIKDEENKFDMLVRNCFAHDGKRGPIELVDKSGCITRPKLMSRFTKIKNFGSSATVLSYAHFQAFKFPDSMEVHFQCTIQICRHQCPEQCSANPAAAANALGGPSPGEAYSESTISGTFNINSQASASSPSSSMDSMHLRKYGSPALSRERRDAAHHHHINSRRWLNGSQSLQSLSKPASQTVGLNRIIQVVSTGDLAFALQQKPTTTTTTGGQEETELVEGQEGPQASQLTSRIDLSNNQICMSSYNFVLALVMLVLILLCSAMLAVSLYVRQRSLLRQTGNGKLAPPHYQQHQQQQQQQQQQQHQGSSSTLNKLLVAQTNTHNNSHSPHHNNNNNNNHHHLQQQHQHVPTSKQQGFY